MAKTQASKTTATHDRGLRALESELEKVTERFRVAKLKARAAKAEAKAFKKEMKHARSALIAAQDEHEANSRPATKKKSSVASSGRAGAKAKTVTHAAPKRRIADSPESVRQPPRRRRSASVAVSTPAPPPPAPPPPEATPPSELLEPDAHREPHPDEADSEQASPSR